jgi:hypothetical protein
MTQPATPKAVDYETAIRSLFDLLATANFADSDEKQPWQTGRDAMQQGGFYGHIRAAIIEVAGLEIVRNWEQFNELELSLANRK